MGDDAIGTVEGTATYRWVEISLSEDFEKARVHGVYEEGGDATVYECDVDRVRIGGMKIRTMFDSVQLEPADGNDWVWVEATEDELRITSEKPDGE